MAISVTVIDEYKNFGRCIRVSNGTVEMLATVDLGPRIIRFGFVGGKNIMFNDIDRKHITHIDSMDEYYYEGASWYNYGGHRLWASPEALPQTYCPDNDAVEYEIIERGVILTPKPQTKNGIAFSMKAEMADDGRLTVTHYVKNISNEDKTMSAWAVSVLDRGGVEIIPNNTEDTGLLANRRIVAWSYTDLSDERAYFGRDFITLRQKDGKNGAFKLGLDNHSGVAMYLLGDLLFVNRYVHDKSAEYEDYGCSFETYTGDDFLELETLGAKTLTHPGDVISHVETWELHKVNEPINERDDNSIHSVLDRFM